MPRIPITFRTCLSNLNTYGVGGNALVLVGYALGLIILAAVALRRSTLAH